MCVGTTPGPSRATSSTPSGRIVGGTRPKGSTLANPNYRELLTGSSTKDKLKSVVETVTRKGRGVPRTKFPREEGRPVEYDDIIGRSDNVEGNEASGGDGSDENSR